jgi:putative endonuclease
MYYTYVLRSKSDGKLYIGYSDDLVARMKKHNEGKVDATKSRLPLQLIYYEACLDQRKAILREKYLKSGFGRSFLKKRI